MHLEQQQLKAEIPFLLWSIELESAKKAPLFLSRWNYCFLLFDVKV
jgi:hypothetical protein